MLHRVFVCLLAVAIVMLESNSAFKHVWAQTAPGVSLPTIAPAKMASEREEIALPAPADEIVAGGGGRYLVMKFKSLNKLGIFDVQQLKIIGEVPLPDAEAKFAAGATKLLLISNAGSVISRYDLATQAKELTQTIDLGATPIFVLLGSASSGPAIVGAVSPGVGFKVNLVGLDSLSFVPNQPKLNISGNDFRISADGGVVSFWAGGSPSGLNSYVRAGNTWTLHNEHTSVGHVIPSPNGRFIYTANGIYTNQLRRVSPVVPYKEQDYTIPALQGPFYLSVIGATNTDKNPPISFALKTEGEQQSLGNIAGLGFTANKRDDPWYQQKSKLDLWYFLIPDADVVLQLVSTKDKLVAVRLNLDKLLAEASFNYLIVTSRPPVSLAAGQKLSYQLTAKAKAGSVTYSLDAGPEGMQLSPAGLLTWSPTAQSPATSNVIITAKDKGGQQAFHTFTLAVAGGNTKPAAEAVAIKPVSGGAAKLLPTKPAAIPEQGKTVQLPAVVTRIACGGNGRFLLLYFRDLKQIGVFDVSQVKIVGYLPAADDDTKFVAGATRALVFSQSQGVVARYRLDTLEREQSTTIPFTDLIQYAGMGAGSEGPVMVRTAKGTGQLDAATFQFVDLNTLKLIEMTWPSGRPPHVNFRDQNAIHVATNGSVYTVQGFGALRLSGATVQYVGTTGGFGSRGVAGGLPAADGSHFLQNGQLFNADQRPIGDAASNYGIAIPAITGRYFLGFKPVDNFRHGGDAAEKQSAKIYMFGDNRPLLTIADLPVSVGTQQSFNAGYLGWDQRIFFVPDAHALITLPSSNDRLELRRLNVDEALEASGVDYLVVESQPPATAQLGKPYTYPIKVKSKKGSVKLALDSGPAGMKIGTDGVLTWTVPSDLTEERQNVVISVSDASGQSTFHTFSIEISELKARAAEAQRLEKERLAAERAAANAAAQQPPKVSDPATSKPVVAMRVWSDSTGSFKLTAKFVEVLDKKTVVLELENGETRKIPLSRLSETDVYEAVKADLLRQGLKPSSGVSPFEKP